MQKITDNGTTVLLADDGMILTDDSSFGKTVRLGKGDDGAKWHEITECEYEAIIADAIPGEDTATATDYRGALREMGVMV